MSMDSKTMSCDGETMSVRCKKDLGLMIKTGGPPTLGNQGAKQEL